MHYYKKNIGDYHKKAGRLNMLQHGAYNQLIDSCYDRERFPTEREAIDWVWASTTDEIEAVKFVLSKFFTLTDGAFVQKRIASDLAKYHENSATNKRIAIERETKRKGNSTNRVPTVDEPPRTEHEAPPNHKPLTTNQEPLSNKTLMSSATANDAPNVPYQKILDAYHEKLKALPRVQVMTEKRKSWLKSRWRENDQMQSVDRWADFFAYVSQSDFLMGRSAGDRVWSADFEWLINSTNFVKVSEGTYHQ